MQLGFYFDQSKCVGCCCCVIACICEYSLAFPDVIWRRVSWLDPRESFTFLSISCMHCAEPLCVEACPVGAITKREENGIVVVDQDSCLGKDACSECKDACPYDALQFGPESNAAASKCDLCLDRVKDGKRPVCVDACCFEALDYGPLDRLRAKYGDLREAPGFEYSEEARPSFVIKGKPVEAASKVQEI